ncbi:hypothetical protein [Paracraurococcus lichenis]|uniref:Muramidase n=1 Tax=Paracraurococcus lichenis TaxID=3064888 RepID=A0ABT9DWR1_9PROT|nr:hypothetical protein [Paracraurococcus sp. LOR1-02]MDO9708331.1 hypothetical protein [Paracraurococcus sp. LOR1-02]
MDATVFRDTIVKPALLKLNRWSDAAEKLIMGTAAQESGLKFTRQIGGGPALGYFQMEPATHDDCWTNFINFRASLKSKLLSIRQAQGMPSAAELETDHVYAAAMARVRYMRAPESLPADGKGLARYWKQHYNTPLGAGTISEFIASWNRLLAPKPYDRIA